MSFLGGVREQTLINVPPTGTLFFSFFFLRWNAHQIYGYQVTRIPIGYTTCKVVFLKFLSHQNYRVCGLE